MSVQANHLIEHEERPAPELRVVHSRPARTGLGFASMMLALCFVFAEFAWLSFLGYVAIRYLF